MSKTYKIVPREDGNSLYAIEANGKVWSIAQNPASSSYQEYLRYTAWVEAGNTPEDFWTQSDE